MSFETRMVKYKPLHNELNKEIEYWKNIESQKTQTNMISEKLRIVDKPFFEPKIKSFTKTNDIFKPYLDKDRSNLLISEEIKFELKRYLNELTLFESTHEKKHTNDERTSLIETKKLVIKDEKLQKMYLSIAGEVNSFNEKIRKASEINQKTLATSNIPPAAIEEMREEGQSKFHVTAKEASIKIEKSILTLDKNIKVLFPQRMNKVTVIVGVVLIALLLLMLILFSIL